MIPKGNYALLLLIFSLLSCSPMMAGPGFVSPTEGGFNDSLNKRKLKSTSTTFNALEKVVIDAGHGGKDPGGMGENSREKHIALSIAQLLAIGIRTNYPEVEVIMTRSDDTFIPLYERAAIANDAGADLFISIHANIMPGGTSTYGTETFVMGQHVAKHNLSVAKRENASILLEDNVEQNYGYDPNSDEGHIMMSMFQHAFLERSIQFAELVENEFSDAGRKSRGVKQAGFVVLKETTMPSVLVETGFMSNPDEEAFLMSDAGQRKLANSLLRAFGKYHERITGQPGPVIERKSQPVAVVASSPAVAVNKPAAASNVLARQEEVVSPPTFTQKASVFGREIQLSENPPPAARQQQWTAKGVGESPLVYKPSSSVVPYYSAPEPSNTPAVITPPNEAPKPTINQYEDLVRRQVQEGRVAPPNRVVPRGGYVPVTYGTPVMAADTVNPRKGKGYTFGEAKKREAPPKPKGPDLKRIPDAQLLYAVQIIATKRELNLDEPQWQRLPYPILKIVEGNLNKYQARGLRTAADAKTAKERINSAGFYDAMIVVYLDGKRLPPASVRYLLGR
ncbi:N-acetylmuramoyl-L-alanine amidase [Neolewinella agarilytica]|uniref:N-acetylmuramoyl-L-alanine amidase family protein n=1 Tax=Neolewinella agarilytica TaxID=478744 RepID=UPI00308117E3